MTIFILTISAAIAAFLMFVTTRPSEFSVTRSKTYPFPAATLFPHINNLAKWQAWSPWARLDPNATNTFSGPQEGVGASMSWQGNHNVGQGSMTITETSPSAIKMRLDFLKPMKATNTTLFTLNEENGSTTLIWSMSGSNNFLGKAMSLVFNCDKMVGGQFENGLKNLEEIIKA